MDDDAANLIKVKLDAALKEAGPNVGIAFGTELFSEFRSRGWLTVETFGHDLICSAGSRTSKDAFFVSNLGHS